MLRNIKATLLEEFIVERVKLRRERVEIFERLSWKKLKRQNGKIITCQKNTNLNQNLNSKQTINQKFGIISTSKSWK